MKSCNLISKEKEENNRIKSIDKFENIKSKCILKNVFNYLEKKKYLNVVKYNKNIMKRINININDYKEYSEKYTSIEIEIKPCSNKLGKFINIKGEDEIYYHIYFNNNEEEIKRNYIKGIDKGIDAIKIINIKIDYQVKTFEDLFSHCYCIESISFKKFYRNNINNMGYMFYECSSLKEINFYNFNTDNVTNMRSMFHGCSSLKELNLNNFNTNNVIDMYCMFYECSSLKEINLNNFNTSNVTDMGFMFYKCLSLKELNLNNFNTQNVTYMSGMFSGCSNELIMKIKTQYKNIREESFKN